MKIAVMAACFCVALVTTGHADDDPMAAINGLKEAVSILQDKNNDTSEAILDLQIKDAWHKTQLQRSADATKAFFKLTADKIDEIDKTIKGFITVSQYLAAETADREVLRDETRKLKTEDAALEFIIRENARNMNKSLSQLITKIKSLEGRVLTLEKSRKTISKATGD